ncbi:MAG TPA: hypothetical protein VLG76_04715 [Rhabdochlamydiaceae bacterium]|nr:hypothetical protein [Rhabdochlamydiaceae bacterium]
MSTSAVLPPAVIPHSYYVKDPETVISEEILYDTKLSYVHGNGNYHQFAHAEGERLTQRISIIDGRRVRYYITPSGDRTTPQLTEYERDNGMFKFFLGLLLFFGIFLAIMACVL